MIEGCLTIFGLKLFTQLFISWMDILQSRWIISLILKPIMEESHVLLIWEYLVHCDVHVPSEWRHKFEPKRVKGVFGGYTTCEKGYRVFDPISKKLIRQETLSLMKRLPGIGKRTLNNLWHHSLVKVRLMVIPELKEVEVRLLHQHLCHHLYMIMAPQSLNHSQVIPQTT